MVRGDLQTRLGYRPALDGLRAVAVLAVIGYHLDYKWLRGGFVGVDLFFVLSGYLITSLLLVEHERTGRIDFVAFWLRRAKRLLPAVLLLIIAIALYEATRASIFELTLRRGDLLWTLFYGSNWHFIASSQDYFAQFSEASPVRHTWSLAVEEQFYLAWPLIVGAVLSRTRDKYPRLIVVCGLGAILSAAVMALLYDRGNPSRAYYGTDARIHQPLLGALLAILSRGDLLQRFRRFAPSLSLVGAAIILVAMRFLNDHDAIYWRGFSILLALGGTALIWGLEAAPTAPSARLLSLEPFRWTGKISYGLYLWHWPVTFAIRSAPVELAMLPGSTGLNMTRLAATFGLAAASFYLVEQPIRSGRAWGIGHSSLRFAIATACATLLAAGITLKTTAVSEIDGPIENIPGCPTGFSPCVRHQGSRGAPVVALIGDSIARSLDAAFAELSRKRDWTYILGATNGCRVTHLLTSYDGVVRGMDRECYEMTPRLHQQVLGWHPSLIVAIDRWEIMDVADENGRVISRGTPSHLAVTERAVRKVSEELTSSGARLVFIELPPILSSECGRPAQSSASIPVCRVQTSADEQGPYNEILRHVGRVVPRVSTISITDVLCPEEVCTWRVGGLVPRFDGMHFTSAANVWLAPILYRDLVRGGAVQ